MATDAKTREEVARKLALESVNRQRSLKHMPRLTSLTALYWNQYRNEWLERIENAALDQAFVDKVSGPLHGCYQYIGSDLHELPGRITNKVILEMCIDADRLWNCVTGEGPQQEALAAEDELSIRFQKFGYDKTFNYLNRRVRF
jgi:hypothetical protein